MRMDRLRNDFFQRDALIVAPELLGKVLVRSFSDNQIKRYTITEVEAYRGMEDKACHASKGRTKRTEVMFHEGGKVYVYLIYGMYWMLNLVTGRENEPSAALIRGLEAYNGPGIVGKELQLDKSFYGEDLSNSQRIWLETAQPVVKYHAGPRIGVSYAGEIWANKAWRFYL